MKLLCPPGDDIELTTSDSLRPSASFSATLESEGSTNKRLERRGARAVVLAAGFGCATSLPESGSELDGCCRFARSNVASEVVLPDSSTEEVAYLLFFGQAVGRYGSTDVTFGGGLDATRNSICRRLLFRSMRGLVTDSRNGC